MEEERGPRCGIENCRSRRYHLGEDGYRYCSNGHRAPTQVATQDEDFVTAISRRTRKRTEATETVPTVFEGSQAIELYLQCFQLILRKQAWWLVQSGYPAELEIVIQDLWALRLELLGKRMLEDDQDAERIFSSQQSEAEDENYPPGTRTVKIKRFKTLPKLIETLGLCYIGLLLMHIPVISKDVRGWVLDDGFPYLQAIRALQPAMVQRLPPALHSAFNVQTGLLALAKLHATTMNLAAALRTKFGIEFPPLNHPLLVNRIIEALCLPLEIFPAVDNVQAMLDLTYTFLFPPEKHTQISTHPELQLLTALIIAVKLFYPFDSIPRHPTSATEPAALAVDWKIWNQLHADEQEEIAAKAHQRSSLAELLEVKEEDVFHMSGQKMDDFMDEFGSMYIEEDEVTAQGPEADFWNALYAMFPMKSTPSTNPGSTPAQTIEDAAHDRRLKAVQASLVPLKVIDEEDAATFTAKILRPGSRYRNYRNFGEVPERGRLFLEEAAGLANVEVEEMVLALFQMEMRLQAWVSRERRGVE